MVVRFGRKVGQIGPKWDKFRTFQIRFQSILVQPNRANLTQLWSHLCSVVQQSQKEFLGFKFNYQIANIIHETRVKWWYIIYSYKNTKIRLYSNSNHWNICTNKTCWPSTFVTPFTRRWVNGGQVLWHGVDRRWHGVNWWWCVCSWFFTWGYLRLCLLFLLFWMVKVFPGGW